jgi:hypothetical protein
MNLIKQQAILIGLSKKKKKKTPQSLKTCKFRCEDVVAPPPFGPSLYVMMRREELWANHMGPKCGAIGNTHPWAMH